MSEQGDMLIYSNHILYNIYKTAFGLRTISNQVKQVNLSLENHGYFAEQSYVD